MLASIALFWAVVSTPARIAAEEAVERARYAFVIGAKPPFERQYPHEVFVNRVHDEQEREAILRRTYAVRITAEYLHDEYARIEKATQAPEQWRAIKAALHDDRQLIEEVICRPILVDRALRAKYAFDPVLHGAAHQKAREARAELLAGRTPAGTFVTTIARSSQADVPGGREAAALFETQLREPGDVSNILEYGDRFEVYRLIDVSTEAWRVETIRIPKQPFDVWYETVSRQPR